MIALLASAALVLIYNLQGSGKTVSSSRLDISTSAPAQARAGTLQGADAETSLRLDALALSQQNSYEIGGRNIFRMQEIESKSVSIPPRPTQEHDKQQMSEVPQSPPIPLKYYGFAKERNEPSRIFLQDNGEVFIAKVGDIVERRYKVIEISKSSITIQDLLDNSGQPIQLPIK